MKNPQYMTYVLDAAALVVVGINLPFALYGYYMFGGNTQGLSVYSQSLRLVGHHTLSNHFPILTMPVHF